MPNASHMKLFIGGHSVAIVCFYLSKPPKIVANTRKYEAFSVEFFLLQAQ